MNTHQTPPVLRRAGLFVLLAGQLLPQVDFSIVNVALDAIAHSLNASQTELELMEQSMVSRLLSF